MTTTFNSLWNAGTLWAAATNVLTTELNTLTNGSTTVFSAEFDNTTTKDQYADFAFTGGGSITPTGAANMVLYIMQPSGTTYPVAVSTGEIVSVRSVPTTAGTQAVTFKRVTLPFSKFKVALQQNTNVSLSSSGNILTGKSFNDSSVG